MYIKCPKCGSTRIVPVGQYDKFIYYGLGGTFILGIAGLFVPGLWLFIPAWFFICLIFYRKNPLAACEDCDHGWNPREPKA